MRILDMNANDVMQAFKDSYTKDINTQMVVGSEEYMLSLIFAYCISVLIARINTAYNNCTLDNAQGEALDNIGALYNIPREYANANNKTYIDVCVGLRHVDALTKDTRFNICGMDFKPETIQYKDGYTITRLVSDSVLNENIPIETIRESLDKIAYDQYQDFIYLDAQSIFYPVVQKFEYTVSGDNAYREYIKDNRFVNLTGTAKAFKQYTKGLHPSIKDVAVVTQSDAGYVPGVVKIYTMIDGPHKYAPYVCMDMVNGYINKVFDNDRVVVIGQTRDMLTLAMPQKVRRVYDIRKPKSVTPESIYKFYEAIVNYYNKRMLFGVALNDSDVQKLLITPLKDISNNPNDFDLTQIDYDAIANVCCVTSASHDGEDVYIKPNAVYNYMQLEYATPNIIDSV